MSNLLLGQSDPQRDFSAVTGAGQGILRPIDQKLGDLFRNRAGEPKRANLFVGALSIVRKLLRDLHAYVGMSLQKADEIITLDKIRLARLQGFHCGFIRSVSYYGSQTQNFAWLGNAQDNALALR